MAEQLRLMAVHAHPDDESSKGAATLARYVDEGAEVLVVSCTGGERGDILNPKLKDDAELLRDIAEVRRREMANAVKALGVKHEWLGFVDSGLPEGDPLPPLPEGCFGLQPLEVTTEPLVRLIRQYRPHVITTYDETGGYPHPDHIMCHKVSVAAYEAAPDPERFPDQGEPWQPLKLYYDRGFSVKKMMAFHQAFLDDGKESPFVEWMKRREEWAKDREEPKVTTQVDVADWFERRDQALLAHATQIDPDGWFFAIPHDMQRKIWPYEDYELVRSLVESELPEDDLFAGVREAIGTGSR